MVHCPLAATLLQLQARPTSVTVTQSTYRVSKIEVRRVVSA